MKAVLEKPSISQTEKRTSDNRASLERLLNTAGEISVLISDTSGKNIPTPETDELDLLRNAQRQRITDRINRGTVLDLTGIENRIYPQPQPKRLSSEQEDIDVLRSVQQERLQHKERKYREQKRNLELTQQFFRETQQKIQQAFSEFQNIQKQLNNVRGHFTDLTTPDRAEFKLLAEHAISILHSVSVRKAELFACLQFMQDQGFGRVSLSAEQLTQYHQGSQNHSAACNALRYDISFDPGRDTDTMKTLEQTEVLEEEFRSLLDQNLQLLRPNENETTRIRRTSDLKKELIELTKQLFEHEHTEAPSILSEAIRDRFEYLQGILKERKAHEK